MVFRKPYGFLIKHFKLIHLILTGLFIYLTIYVSKILDYYNDFVSGTASKLDAFKYINSSYVVAVVLAIIICLIVYALLRYKKKPRLVYLVLIIFSLMIAFMINMVQGGLEVIYFKVLDTKTLRLYRDLLKILVVFQYISVIFILIRGLGFDIKKFNFAPDLHELNLDVTDEEEVELTLGNMNGFRRRVNKRLRELKYYYLENKAFIIVILVVLLGCGCSFLFVKNEIVDKVYMEGEQVSTSNFNFKVVSSYVTRKGYDNEIITEDDYSYVVVKMNISSQEKVLNTANLILEINNNSYVNDGYNGNGFSDLGLVYKNQKINGNHTYLFIYKINSDDIYKKMRLVYANAEVISLTPIMLDEISLEESYQLGEEIDFYNTTFGSGNLAISTFEINNGFSYSYKYEMGGQTFTGEYMISSNQGAIMRCAINGKYPFGLSNYDFLKTYASLKYKIGDNEYVSKMFDNKTPGNEKVYFYVAVDKKITQADYVWFDIRVRNYKYIYRLK